MRAVLVGVALAGLVSVAQAAETKADVDEYAEFRANLAMEDCQGTRDAIRACAMHPMRQRFIREVTLALHGQKASQRWVAAQISNGHAPVRRQDALGCAWWIVVTAVPGGASDNMDIVARNRVCLPMSAGEQRLALNWAREMMNLVVAYPSLPPGRRRPTYCNDYLDSTAAPLGTAPSPPPAPRRPLPPECR